MSEPLLQAILRLFAVVAKEDTVTHQERDQIRIFLEEHLSQSAVSKYLKMFDDYIAQVHKGEGSQSDLEKVNELCTEVNSELTQKQKVVIVLELFNIIQAD